MTDAAVNDKALYKALAEFQKNCPQIVKDKIAKVKTKAGYTYEYKYADLSMIVLAIRKPLAEAGLSFSQPIRTVDGKSKLLTKIFHIDGGCIESDMDLPSGNIEPQSLGSYLTYYRRYMLTSALSIALISLSFRSTRRVKSHSSRFSMNGQ